MAKVSAISRSRHFYPLLLITSLLFASQILVSSVPAPIAKGLDWNFYGFSCPAVEFIVRKHLEHVFKKNSGVAPGLLRLFFHDCFPQGCDGSILLRDEGKDERSHGANIGIREEAIQVIEELRVAIGKRCPRVVSCSDILVIAAREAVRQFGGPEFFVPLGRRDSLTYNTTAPNNLPPPFFRTEELLARFENRGFNFNPTDVVALSGMDKFMYIGAHTFGRCHCSSLANRTIESDPQIEPKFKKLLEATCPDPDSPNTVKLDVRSPVRFDNLYYINLLSHQGVFTSDQDLESHDATKEIVALFASNQNVFFNKFAEAFVKMSQVDVLTGNQGEIRRTCFAPNNKKSSPVFSVVEEAVDLAQNF